MEEEKLLNKVKEEKEKAVKETKDKNVKEEEIKKKTTEIPASQSTVNP